MESFEVRRACRADWPAIAHLHDRSRIAELAASIGAHHAERLPSFAGLADRFDGELWLAVEGGDIVGFVGARGGEIVWLYVDPAHFRRGIGTLLLRHALSLSRVVVHARVLSGNAPALALYQAEGFVLVETTTLTLPGLAEPAAAHLLRRLQPLPLARGASAVLA